MAIFVIIIYKFKHKNYNPQISRALYTWNLKKKKLLKEVQRTWAKMFLARNIGFDQALACWDDKDEMLNKI